MGLEHLCYEGKQRNGLVQPGEVSVETSEQLPVPKRAEKKSGEGL